MVSLPFEEGCVMHRFFSDPGRSTASEAFLTKEDARHAVTVLRLRPGQHVCIIADGCLWEAEVLSADTTDVRVRFLSPLPSTEPSLSVTLFQGLPKADKMELIIQKATELGVSSIVPVLLNRCVARPDAKDISRRLERWNRIAREAAKQSGRSVIPAVSAPVTVDRLSDACPLPETSIVPWEEAAGYGPLSFHNDHPSLSSLGILIGPEGGIEPKEIDCLRSLGFIPVTLGKRILRTETAGLAAVSSLMTLYGEME